MISPEMSLQGNGHAEADEGEEAGEPGHSFPDGHVPGFPGFTKIDVFNVAVLTAVH